MAKRSNISGKLPTGREFAWFVAWTALVLLLVYLAKSHFVFDLALRSENGTGGGQGEVLVEIESQSTEPVAISEPPVALRPLPSISLESSRHEPTDTVASGKSGWSPDALEEAGDARRIAPEEVKWLQEQLQSVKPGAPLPSGEAYKAVRELAQRVGAIPYVPQTHGWGLPEQTLRRNEGDCADKSLLLAELLIEAGVEEVAICKGVGEGYVPGEPGHAWVQAMIGSRLWRIESTNGQMRVANSDWILDRYEAVATIWRLKAED